MSSVHTTLAADSKEIEIPYRRSWVDWLTHLISRVPGPSWLFYLTLLLVLAFLNNAVFWLDGSLAAGSFDPFRLADVGYIVIPLAVYHHLSLVAGRTFRIFRPVLRVSDSEVHTLKYRLTTLPRGLGWLAILVGAPLAIADVQATPEAYGLDEALTLLPVFFQHLYPVIAVAAMFALVIQTVRQLRLVNELHREAEEVNLFQLVPAHAFSTLTARAGIGMVVLIVFNYLVEQSNLREVNLFILLFFGTVALAVFVMPLLGMRNRLNDEKARLLGETNEAIEQTIGRIHGRVNSNEYDEISGLNTAMSALIVERDLIKSISTWPWEPGTLRGFATTILLPIFLWAVTRLLEGLV